jgi:hypothetical protein
MSDAISPKKCLQPDCQADKPLAELEAAQMLGVAVQTLRNWRCMQKGPAYHKYGRRVIYMQSGIEDYKSRHCIDPEVHNEK